jgi:hypothetical protein
MRAERDDLIEQFGDEYLRLIDKIEGNRMGYRHEIATLGLPATGYTYSEALELAQQRNRLDASIIDVTSQDDDIRRRASALGLHVEIANGGYRLSWPGEDTSQLEYLWYDNAIERLEGDALRQADHQKLPRLQVQLEQARTSFLDQLHTMREQLEGLVADPDIDTEDYDRTSSLIGDLIRRLESV